MIGSNIPYLNDILAFLNSNITIPGIAITVPLWLIAMIVLVVIILFLLAIKSR